MQEYEGPDKVKEATNYVAPLVDEFFTSIKPWAQVKTYAVKNREHDNQATQRMHELEEEAAKYKQRLRGAGLQVTFTRTAAHPQRRLHDKGRSHQGRSHNHSARIHEEAL